MGSPVSKIYNSVRYKPVFLHKEVLPNIFCSSYLITNFPFAERLDLFSVVEPSKKVLFFDVGKKELCGTKGLDCIIENTQVGWEDAEVVLSHFHDDHDGCLDYCIEQGVTRAFHGPRAMYSEQLNEQYLLQSGIYRHGDTSLREYIDFFLLKNRFNEHTKSYLYEVEEGMEFSLAGYTFHVIYTPGHTPEHISLYEPDWRIMFAGDFILDGAPGVMQFEPQTHLLQEYLSKLWLTHKANINVLFMSHRESLFDTQEINALIDKQIDSYLHPLTKVLGLFLPGELLDTYEIAQRYQGSAEDLASLDPSFRIRKIAMMTGYLDFLCQTGNIERNVDITGRELFSLRNRNFEKKLLRKISSSV